jgi:dTDP-4-dehydrorhamnose 3,5-epimerase
MAGSGVSTIARQTKIVFDLGLDITMSNSILGLNVSALSEYRDNRGSFLRLFDIDWLHFLNAEPQQVNISRNKTKGTLRGMHYQLTGDPEHKLISVLSGSVYLVVIDLRAESESYLKTFSCELDSNHMKRVFVPAGCATGWITLQDNTDVHYVMYSRFEECTYGGLRFNDPFFELNWPLMPNVISNQDASWPDFKPNYIQS